APLVFAAATGRAPAIRALLRNGAKVGERTKMENLQEQAALEQAAARKRNAVLVSWEPEKHINDTNTVQLNAAGMPIGVNPPPTGGDPNAIVAPPAGGGGGAGGGRGGAAGPRAPAPKGPFTPTQLQAAIDSG